jgi:hypothetical protein
MNCKVDQPDDWHNRGAFKSADTRFQRLFVAHNASTDYGLVSMRAIAARITAVSHAPL